MALRRELVVLVMSLGMPAGLVVACASFSERSDPTTSLDATVGEAAATDALSGDREASLSRRTDQRYVFVTQTMAGNFSAAFDGGVGPASLLCATAAAGSPLDGRRWKAWLSDLVVSAATFVTGRNEFEWIAPSGGVVFNKGTLGATATARPLNGFETVRQDLYAGRVWTGSDTNGSSASGAHCANWTGLLNAYGRYGIADPQADAGVWLSSADSQCTEGAAIYCFESD